MDSEIKILESTNRNDYEILLRKRGTFEYAAYCPQLNYMVKGKEHNEVKSALEEYIDEHIEKIEESKRDIYAIEDDLPAILISKAEGKDINKSDSLLFDDDNNFELQQADNG